MGNAIAIITQILTAAAQLGPVIAQAAINFGPVQDAVRKILKGQTVTDDELVTLQGIADALYAANQASPETPDDT